MLCYALEDSIKRWLKDQHTMHTRSDSTSFQSDQPVESWKTVTPPQLNKQAGLAKGLSVPYATETPDLDELLRKMNGGHLLKIAELESLERYQMEVEEEEVRTLAQSTAVSPAVDTPAPDTPAPTSAMHLPEPAPLPAPSRAHTVRFSESLAVQQGVLQGAYSKPTASRRQLTDQSSENVTQPAQRTTPPNTLRPLPSSKALQVISAHIEEATRSSSPATALTLGRQQKEAGAHGGKPKVNQSTFVSTASMVFWWITNPRAVFSAVLDDIHVPSAWVGASSEPAAASAPAAAPSEFEGERRAAPLGIPNHAEAVDAPVAAAPFESEGFFGFWATAVDSWAAPATAEVPSSESNVEQPPTDGTSTWLTALPWAAPATAAVPPATASLADEPKMGKYYEPQMGKCWLAVEFDKSLCFAAGYGDLVSALALACCKKRLRSALSPWLRGLRWGQLLAHEPVTRLRVAADAILKLEHLQELRVGAFDRLDARWLRTAVASRNILDIRGLINATSSVQLAFAFATIACRACRSGAVSRVVLHGGCDVDLRGRALNLSKKSLGDEGASSVAGALAGASMPQLRELNLSLNKLGDPAMQSLGAAVKSGALSSLRVMRLSENRIGAVGARAFAEAITGGQRLSALTLLSFDGNQLGDAGVAALAGPLGDGALPALEELGLVRNGITAVAPLVAAIAKGEMPLLRRLLLQHNQLGDGALRDLVDTVGSAKPKPGVHDVRSPPHRPRDGLTPLPEAADGANGVAVRIRGVFQPKEILPKDFMRARRLATEHMRLVPPAYAHTDDEDSEDSYETLDRVVA